MFFYQDQIGVPLEGDLSLTVAQKQIFTIREISLDWGYTTEATTMLLSDSPAQKGDIESAHHLLRRLKADDELWGQVIEALLVGSGTSSGTIEWLMQELLKVNLQQWLSSKSMGESDQPGCSLSKKEQGIIHMIAGLGFEWALNLILSHACHKREPLTNEDQLSLKDTWAAVRNAAQAAACIQSGFCAHSFRRRQQKDGLRLHYELQCKEKMVYKSMNFYVFWQAHVRGYQVRKNYKVICWAVGVLDKVILWWRWKGVGLRGFWQETESSIDDSEDEDILKLIRKEKVDGAIDEAVSRVLGMVDSLDAHQQYRHMLERYRQGKAELGATAAAATISKGDIVDMDNDDSLE
ncbi:hypothetical protein Ddye_027031 [Dipteronia dyeriana]|uniref:Uncharacterized protein n=1 Tax=Dipteronia dyeriana TaxID=168575 RepID=A0AAD9TNI2_9ROSI|nr:hypothetical protein Ddye_027031 [Dipteronia dyeriana]